MKKRLLSDEEAEKILGGCDEIAKAGVNFAEYADHASEQGTLQWDCTEYHKIRW